MIQQEEDKGEGISRWWYNIVKIIVEAAIGVGELYSLKGLGR